MEGMGEREYQDSAIKVSLVKEHCNPVPWMMEPKWLGFQKLGPMKLETRTHSMV